MEVIKTFWTTEGIFLVLLIFSMITTGASTHTNECGSNPVASISRNQECGKNSPILLFSEDDGDVQTIPICESVRLTCRSKHPVGWLYEGPQNDTLEAAIKSVKPVRTSSGPWNGNHTTNFHSETSCYEVTIEFHQTYAVSSGRYTCSELVLRQGATTYRKSFVPFEWKNRTSSSIYVYEPAPESELPKILNVFRSPRGFYEVVIPCRSKNHTLTPNLTRLNSTNQEVELNNFKHDLRIGFHVQGKTVEEVSGTYECYDDQSKWSVFVKYDKKIYEHSSDLNIGFDKNGGLFTCNQNGSNALGLKSKILSCDNPFHCNLLWQANKNDLRITKAEPPRSSGLVICVNKENQYEFAEFLRTVDGQITINPLSAEEKDLAIWDNIKDDIKGEFILVNTTLKVSCNSSQYKFSMGSNLLVEYKNGSVASAENMVISRKNETMLASDGFYRYKWEFRASSVDVIRFFCVAPVLDSEDWEFRESKDFTIEYGTAPKILYAESSPSIVQVYETDTDFNITCVARGYPSPIIEWFKDGDMFPFTYKKVDHEKIPRDDNETEEMIFFKKAKNIGVDIDGIWVCNASNGVEPRALYEINLIAVSKSDQGQLTTHRNTQESHTEVSYIFAGITIGAAILFVAVGICFCFVHRRVFERKIQRQLAMSSEEVKRFLYGDRTFIQDLKSLMGVSGRRIASVLPYQQKKYELSPRDLTVLEESPPLGEGTFGVVKKGMLKRSNGEVIEVAVKSPKRVSENGLYRRLFLSEPNFALEAIKYELKILGYVGQHEHIVSLVGAVTTKIDEGKIQVVLEYCGPDLHDFLKIYGNFFHDEILEDEIVYSPKTTHNNVKSVQGSGYVELSFNPESETVDDEVFETAIEMPETPDEIPETSGEESQISDANFTTSDLIRWSFQIACGMQFLTSRKIIHRDLAARNVLLKDVGGVKVAKISDFGLSKKLRQKQYEYIKPTECSEVLPWHHLAPEVLDVTDMTFSQATDVWAYGITLWEIFSLVRQKIYQGFDYGREFVNQIKNENLRNPKPYYANSYIYDIMCECWAHEPSHRPEFTDLAKMFFELLPEEYRQTIPPSVYEPQKYVTLDDLQLLLPMSMAIEERPAVEIRRAKHILPFCKHWLPCLCSKKKPTPNS